MGSGFPNSGKGWEEIPLSEEEIRNFTEGSLLPGEGNLRRSGFDNSKAKNSFL